MRYILVVVLCVAQLDAGFFPASWLKKSMPSVGLSAYEEKQQTYEALKKTLVDSTRNENTIEKQLKNDELSADFKQVLLETQRARQQLVESVKKHIELLDQYFAHPTFDTDRVAEKGYYRFDDMTHAAQQLRISQEALAVARADKKRVELEQKDLDVQLAQLEQEIKQPDHIQAKNAVFNEKLLKYKLEQAQAKKAALAQELSLIDLRIFLAQSKTDLCAKDLTRIERKLWIGDDAVKQLHNKVAEAQYTHALQHDRFTNEFAELTKTREEVQLAAEQLRTALKTPVKQVLQQADWQFDVQDVQDYARMYELAYLDARLQQLDAARDLVGVQHAQADAQLASKELEFEELKTWIALSQRRLVHAGKAREQQIAFFDGKKKDIERQLSEYKNKETALNALAITQARTLEFIKKQLEHITQQKELFVKKHGEQTVRAVLDFLHKTQELINKQRETNDQLIKEYAPFVTLLNDMHAQTVALIDKLTGLEGILQRDSSAITWQGIKSAALDITFLWDELASSVQLSALHEATAWITRVITDVMVLFNLLLILIIALISYFAGMVVLALVHQALAHRTQAHGSTRVLDSFVIIVQFVQNHVVGLISWMTLFYVVHYDVIALDIRVKIMFYLALIVYLCMLVSAFYAYFSVQHHIILQKPFINRCMRVLYIFLYTTIIVYFLSEIAIIATYGHSEIPTLLWALYSLIIRALFVFLVMTKSIVMELIPSRGMVWSTIHERVDRYYHIFLIVAIALVVLSDPFVGYGRLVSKVIQALVLTGVLGALFVFVQNMMKRYSSHLFFVQISDGAKERFAHGKTWYALFTVLGFGVLIIGALFFLARIWGYSITLASISTFFDAELVRVQTDVPGQSMAITVKSLLSVVAFVFGGFFVSSLFNRYVLQRIYALVQVDSGVQNTVSRISGYLLVIIVFVVGLQRAGLGALVPSITVVMIGIAWALRGPADDFVAYFMILVERSVKIGDYICLDSAGDEISGVVRKITPRSIVLRKKNSYTIVVPNSTVMRSRILNWNASRGYCAFDDLYIPVDHSADMQQVRDIIMRILNENPLILKSPAPIIRVEGFALNGCDFMVRGFLSISHVLNQWDIRSDIRLAIVQEFKKHNIKLAAPIQSITVQSIRDITSQ
jgi:small-conductance mechanosensitive channel